MHQIKIKQLKFGFWDLDVSHVGFIYLLIQMSVNA